MNDARQRIVDTDECGAPILETERWLIGETAGGRIGQRFVGADELEHWLSRLAPQMRLPCTWYVASRFPT